MEFTKEVVEKFTLPLLPYNQNDLEPYISETTVNIHFNKHHLGYVNKLNNALENYNEDIHSIEELLQNISHFDTSVRNNAGGHYNHAMYWKLLTPEKQEPYGKLLNQIKAAFKNFENFKEQFKNAATSSFGSGWVWLVLDPKGILQIGSTPNQDNPLMDDTEFSGYPILGLDMWEHAYYLDYQNNKGQYIDQFWNIFNWTEAEKRYENALLFYLTEDAH